VGGVHHRDAGAGDAFPPGPGCACGRSCHDAATLGARLGAYDTLIVGPVFASLSKSGHGPLRPGVLDEVRAILTHPQRPPGTVVLAIGGVTPERLAECAALGFDGVAILGAVWQAPEPLSAFARFVDRSASLPIPALPPSKEIPA
jgi:thiamine-phosphate pyrophosphorylase